MEAVEAGQREEGRAEEVAADRHVLAEQAHVLCALPDEEDRAEHDRREQGEARHPPIAPPQRCARPAQIVTLLASRQAVIDARLHRDIAARSAAVGPARWQTFRW